MHQSVEQVSERMKLELRRHNYVTPNNYLELVSGYKKLLTEKHSEVGEQVGKLRSGLFKIDDTQEKVKAMSVELEEAKKQVAQFTKECEEYLSHILQQQEEAANQQKSLPGHHLSLTTSSQALESLNKKDLTEMKSYDRPPALVETVMQAVMTLLGKSPSWADAKKELGDTNFIKTLVNFDKNRITDQVLKKIGTFCRQKDFQPETVGRVSLAAKSLCMWVRAMEVQEGVEPKRAQLNAAKAQLADKQAALSDSQNKLREVGERLEELKRQYGEKEVMRESLRKKSEEMEVKLDRAAKLVTGLAGEKIRWEERGLEKDIHFLVGDCLLAAAFLSYMGPFLSSYRDELLNIQTVEIPCSPTFSFAAFLSKPTAVRDWNIQGLPSDAFSTENGVIITRGNRCPLIIDPQGQALKWIKNMEGLKVIEFGMADYLQVLENAIQFGNPVLLQNVQEELDPSLNPVLNKSLTRRLHDHT
uniref:Dynein heavy chain coiled coil stalk domain-containing protein n=1 Tax=Oryzias melastigma TaxID=30732 RepID=A0A3B3BC08_ORYME